MPSTAPRATRALLPILSALCALATGPEPVRAEWAAASLTTDATALALGATSPASAFLAGVPIQAVVDGADTFTLASQGIALRRSVVESGAGWVRERYAGVAGSLAYTEEAEYFVVTDLTGVDQVPLRDFVGDDFAGFVREKLRAHALATQDPAERVFVLQRSALRAAELLYLDRDAIVQDPYAHLDVTVCVPMPVVGDILEPSFSPEVVIREITPGVLEYREFAALDAAGTGGIELGRLLGTADLRAFRSAGNLALPVGGAPTGAVAQSASAAGGMSCFQLRDVIGSGEGNSCKVDLMRPDTWYREHETTGTLDLTPPDLELSYSIDTADGPDALLSSIYEGTMRLDTDVRFHDEQGRGVGGKIKVRVGSLFCVPLWLRPVTGRLWAHAQLSREVEMNGTLALSATRATQVTSRTDGTTQASPAAERLPDPRELLRTPEQPLFMYPIAFMVGPVPVALILDAPFELGVVAGVETPAVTNLHLEGGVRLGFDYACRFGGSCEEKEEPYVDFWLDSETPGEHGIEGRAFLKPYVGLGFRASLYWPGAIYAKVGPRAFLNAELWGAHKPCGDANGDGAEETVDALTLDVDLGLELAGEIGIYQPPTGVADLDWWIEFLTPYRFPIGEPWIRHLSFFDLLQSGSTALQPMLAGPASVQEDVLATLSARMRPCYPYPDRVDYVLGFGDGTAGDPPDSPAQQASSTTHAWANPGSYGLELTAIQDSHGRLLGTSTRRPLAVTPAPILKPAPRTGSIVTIRR